MSGIEKMISKIGTLEKRVPSNTKLIYQCHRDNDTGELYICADHPYYDNGVVADSIMVIPEKCSMEQWQKDCLEYAREKYKLE